jgi:hypothetical protein
MGLFKKQSSALERYLALSQAIESGHQLRDAIAKCKLSLSDLDEILLLVGIIQDGLLISETGSIISGESVKLYIKRNNLRVTSI